MSASALRRLAPLLVAVAAVAALLPRSGAIYNATTTSAGSATAAAAYSYATAVAASSPVLWWRLGDTSGGTTADSAGSNPGTVSSVGLVRGVPGAVLQDTSTAFRFDGIAGCVTSAAFAASNSPFTLEGWFRSSSNAGGLVVGAEAAVARASGAVTYDRQVYLTAAGRVAFAVRPAGASVVTSPGAYADGQWHHVAATLGTGGQKLYVDGVLVASSGTTSSAGNSAALHAGCGTVDPAFTGAPATGYLRGDVDEVAMYASALSAAAVAEHFQAAPPRQPYAPAVEANAPWGWYRLAESAGTTLADASSTPHNGTTSGTLTRLRDGVVAGNTATTFDGASGCAVVSTAVANPTTFSLEAWFRTTSTSGGVLVGLNATTAAASAGANDRLLYLTPAGQVTFGTFPSATIVTSTSPSSYNDGGWHHAVATLSSAGQRLYVDGALVASAATPGAQSYTGYWHIGCGFLSNNWPAVPSSGYLAGTIDEVAIYGQALDAQTVLRHFRAASVVPSHATQVAAASPYLWWRLGEQGVGVAVPDASGNGRHGLAMPGGLRRGLPGITDDDTATEFDGSTGCVVSNVAQANPTTFSLEAWFRTRSTTGGWIVGFAADGTPLSTGYANHDRNLYLTDAGTLVFGTWTGSAVVTATSSAAYNDGVWHHAVATLSSAGQRLYVDGALVASNATAAAEVKTSWWKVGCGPFDGNWPSVPTTNYFAGTLDEVAVYATVLDPATVAAHYLAGTASLAQQAERQASTPWAWWRLGEASGTALADASGSGHAATVSATGTTAGVPGVFADDKARSFAAGGSGCAVSTASMSGPTTFSLELWFKASGAGGALIGYSDASTADATVGAYDRMVYVDDTGRLTFGVYDGANQAVTTTATYLDGAWHQMVATFGTAGGQRLYVDGALQASGSYTSLWAYTGWWHVGCNPLAAWPNQPASVYFTGSLDEVAIHTIELDPATVAYRYALARRPGGAYGGVARARTPTVHWTFDQTSGNATDASGNGVTGTASGSGVTRRQAPAVGTGLAWAFDGSAGCVASASSFANPTDYSLELWFTTTTTSGGGLIGFMNSSATNATAGTSWDRMLYLDDAGHVVLGATASNVVTSPSTYNDGRWHHVVGSVGTRGMRLYLDGALVASSSYTTVINYTGWWHVGCTRLSTWPSAPTSSYLDGTIDEVTVHPVQLADETVAWHHAAGTALRPARPTGASTIATILGTGTASDTGDGAAATSATIQQPYELGVDPAGNVYVTEFDTGCRVRRIAPNGIVSAFAGTGVCTSTGDGGPATAATINGAAGMAFAPDGSVYIADGYGARVRKVDTSGVITTVAGNGTNGTTGDGGAATSAQIFSPRGLAVDPSGNLYISGRDSNRVRKVTPAGIISTFIGDGTASSTGDGGLASAATVNFVYGVASGPDGTIYVAEHSGCRVRKITTAGVVSTFAGTGTCSSTGDGGAATSATINGPHGIVVDVVGNAYVAERSGQRVRRIDPNGTITTVIGTGTASSTGDGGAGSAATVNDPRGLAFDPAGRLLVVDGHGARVRRLG